MTKKLKTGKSSLKIPKPAALVCLGLMSEVAQAGVTIVAVDDNYITPMDTALVSNGAAIKTLANNDTYGGNVISTLSACPSNVMASIITPPMSGKVKINQPSCITPGTFGSFTYTPKTGFTGSDSFTYRLSQGGNTSNAATVQIVVSADPQAPAVGSFGGAALLVPAAAVALSRRRKKPQED